MRKLIKNPRFLFWLSLGILLRLILMPFTAHEDLFSIYTKASAAVFQNRYYPLSFSYSWLLAHGLILKIYQFLWPQITDFFPSDPITLVSNLQKVLANPYLFRLIFLLKLPFLIIELITLNWFLKFFINQKQKLTALITWLYNPFIIYTLYIHGRFEALPILFIVGFFWFLKNKKLSLASLFLGISLSLRMYPVIFIPFVLLIYPKKLTHFLKQLLILFTPLVATILLSLKIRDTSIIPVQKPALIQEFLLPAKISVGNGRSIYLLPVVLIGLFLYAWLNQKITQKNLWKWCYLTLLITLSLIFFHPQYFTWIALFSAWQLARASKKLHSKLIKLYLVQFLGWLMTSLHWGKSLAFGLLAPINPYFFNAIGSPIVLFERYLPLLDPVSLGRSLILVSHFYLSWLIIKKI